METGFLKKLDYLITWVWRSGGLCGHDTKMLLLLKIEIELLFAFVIIDL